MSLYFYAAQAPVIPVAAAEAGVSHIILDAMLSAFFEVVIKTIIDALLDIFRGMLKKRAAFLDVMRATDFFKGISSFPFCFFNKSTTENISLVLYMVEQAIAGEIAPKHVLLYGPPGTGKTEFMKYLLQLTMELVKKKQYANKFTRVVPIFIPGSFFRQDTDEQSNKAFLFIIEKIYEFMKEGCLVLLCFDEIEILLASSVILSTFLAMLSAVGAKNTEEKGKLILFGTTNGKNNDLQEFPEAFLRRVVLLYLDLPEPETAELIMLHYIDETTRRMNLDHEVRRDLLHFMAEFRFQEFPGSSLSGSDIENMVANACIKAKQSSMVGIQTRELQKAKLPARRGDLTNSMLIEQFLAEMLKKLRTRTTEVGAHTRIDELRKKIFDYIKMKDPKNPNVIRERQYIEFLTREIFVEDSIISLLVFKVLRAF